MSNDTMNGSAGITWKTLIDKALPVIATVLGSGLVVAVLLWHRVGLLEHGIEIHYNASEKYNDAQDVMLDNHERRLDTVEVTVAELKTKPEG